MTTNLIINADDFGSTSAVNAAVAMAHNQGVLTSASLMVTGSAFREAVLVAKENPNLAVGLHLTLSNGKSLLSVEKIPSIVSERSKFADDPVAAALKYYFSPVARKQLRLEIEAQFEKFVSTGLKLSHVDGHQHLHAHPAILPVVVEMAIRYGANGIRIPRDPFRLNMQIDSSRMLSKATVAAGHSYLASVCRRLLRNKGLATCDYAIGSLMSGLMTGDYATKILEELDCGSVELFFHPSAHMDYGPADQFGPNPGDLQALLNPKLSEFISERGYQLTNYAGLSSNDSHHN